MEQKVRKAVSDLGVAAYIKMHGFKCIGRKNRNFYFVMSETEVKQFEELKIEYGNSPFHDFDANLMSLKKLGEYLPEE
jgi:hypothetical protein